MIALAALAGLLVACGGSDDDTAAPASAEPTNTVDVVVTGGPAEPADADTVALANQLMSASVQANLGLPKVQADCAAVFMVNALGAETLIVDGALVDLDMLPAQAQRAAAAAITEAIPNCGITVPSATG